MRRAQALALLMPAGTVTDQGQHARLARPVLISFRCSFIASVLVVGMMIAAPTPRAWQIAPNR